MTVEYVPTKMEKQWKNHGKIVDKNTKTPKRNCQIPKFKENIKNNQKILWSEILDVVDHDELIYKLSLKYLRRDGYDIGNYKIPEVKAFSS